MRASSAPRPAAPDAPRERLRVEEKAASERARTLERELEWIHMAPKARHAKGKARINAYQELLTARPDEIARDLEIYIPPGPRLGDVVIEAQGLAKGFGGTLLIEDASFAIPPGAIVGVIGPNGAGKTTLFRLIVGEETPDAGVLRLGDTVQLAYVDQARADLEPESSVYDVISEGHEDVSLGKVTMNARATCSRFAFSGGDQQKKVVALSGGERNRVHPALVPRRTPTATADAATLAGVLGARTLRRIAEDTTRVLTPTCAHHGAHLSGLATASGGGRGLPACSPPAPTSCSSTSPPTTSTSRLSVAGGSRRSTRPSGAQAPAPPGGSSPPRSRSARACSALAARSRESRCSRRRSSSGSSSPRTPRPHRASSS